MLDIERHKKTKHPNQIKSQPQDNLISQPEEEIVIMEDDPKQAEKILQKQPPQNIVAHNIIHEVGHVMIN